MTPYHTPHGGASIDVNVNVRSDSLAAAALAYAEKGIPVFPLKPGDKKPLTEHGFKDASTDPEQIRQWFKQCPRANIGMPTGERSGLVVIDEDPRHGGDAAALNLPGTTLTAHTAGGGRHFYYLHPGDGVKVPIDHKGTLGAGIDVQGDGAYVVLAPSVVNGKPYQWDAAAADVADLPARLLLPLLKTTPAADPDPETSTATPHNQPTYTPRASGDAAAHWLGKAMERTGAGSGDLTGYWLAIQLLTDPDARDADVDGVLMQYAAAATLDPAHPFTERDAARWRKSAEQSDIVRRGEPARSRQPRADFTAKASTSSTTATDPDPDPAAAGMGTCARCADLEAQIAHLKAANRRLNERLQWIDELMAVPSATLSPSAKCTAVVFRRENERNHPRDEDGMWRVWLGSPDPDKPGGFAERVGLSESTVSTNLEHLEAVGVIRIKPVQDTKTIRDRKGQLKDIPVERLHLDAGPLIDTPKVWQRPEGPRNQGGTRPGAGRPPKACPNCGSVDVVITERVVTEIRCRDCRQTTTDRGPERYTYDAREQTETEMENQLDFASGETETTQESEINLTPLSDAVCRTGKLISDAEPATENQVDFASCWHEYARMRTPDGRRICLRCEQPEHETAVAS